MKKVVATSRASRSNILPLRRSRTTIGKDLASIRVQELPLKSTNEIFGMLKYAGKRASIKEMDDSIALTFRNWKC